MHFDSLVYIRIYIISELFRPVKNKTVLFKIEQQQ